jgi:hypothetical protein
MFFIGVITVSQYRNRSMAFKDRINGFSGQDVVNRIVLRRVTNVING